MFYNRLNSFLPLGLLCGMLKFFLLLFEIYYLSCKAQQTSHFFPIYGNWYSYSTVCPLQFHLIIAGIDPSWPEGLLVGWMLSNINLGNWVLIHLKHSEIYQIYQRCFQWSLARRHTYTQSLQKHWEGTRDYKTSVNMASNSSKDLCVFSLNGRKLEVSTVSCPVTCSMQ